jgi:transcription antitermination factor NusG
MEPAVQKVLSERDVPVRVAAAPSPLADTAHWYAIHTRAKHEKRVAAELQERGIVTFVPVSREAHRWSDRIRVLEVPLFPCYAFVSVASVAEVQATVLQHPSVLRWIGCKGRPSPIPEAEIVALQTVLRSGVPVGPHAFVNVGERVRIRGGSLDGVEGVLIEDGDERKLVVSVDLVGKSVSISLHNYDLERAA